MNDNSIQLPDTSGPPIDRLSSTDYVKKFSILRVTVALFFLSSSLFLTGCQQSGNGVNRYSSKPLFDFSKRPSWLGGQGNRVADNSGFGRDSRFGDSGLPSSDRTQNGYDPQYAERGYTESDPRFADRRPMETRPDDYNRRLGNFDNDNQLLNTEVASLQQRLDLANQYNQQLKEQLAGSTGQISQIYSEREASAQQVASLRMQLEQANQNLRTAQQQAQQYAQQPPVNQLASSGSGGVPGQLPSASIRANNSLLQKLSSIQVRGALSRMDGDVIRIEFSSDQTFVSGTYQIQPAQGPLMQGIVSSIRQSFPRQIVGVEAHWDGTPLNADITDHQLTATQALAVFNELTRLGLPRNQLFTMAMGSNRPRPTGAGNRRLEIVIYPETYDGS